MIRLSQLTQEVLDAIADVYDRVVGGHSREYRDTKYSEEYRYLLESIRPRLQCGNCIQFLFGSRLSRHSKLEIFVGQYLSDGDLVVGFSFYPNYLSEEEEAKGDLGMLRQEFREEVSRILRERNIEVQEGRSQ